MSLKSHIEHLDLPRNPTTHREAHQQARDYITGVLHELGRAVHLQSFPTPLLDEDGEKVQGVNILSLPPEEASPEFLVVAHYDTVDHSPGADDNGSAVALALELAASCPRLAVLFPDLEEQGLLGARHFVTSGQLEEVPALVLESLGFWSEECGTQGAPDALRLGFPGLFQGLAEREFKANFWVLLSLTRELPLAEQLVRSLDQTCMLIPVPDALLTTDGGKELRDFGRSDHLAFWEAGRVCLMLTDTANFRNPNYHQPSDTIETLNFPQMEKLRVALEKFLGAGDSETKA